MIGKKELFIRLCECEIEIENIAEGLQQIKKEIKKMKKEKNEVPVKSKTVANRKRA